MSYYPGFARLVEDALVRMDRPPAWLAQRLGVNHGTVSRWLNHGTRPGDPETVVRIADILGMSSERQALLTAAGYGYQDNLATTAVSVRAGNTPPHNLPAPVTSLVGREAELYGIAERLAAPDCRLLTLWGIGGIGKTRLGLAAAQAQVNSPRFCDGVFYVPLVPLSRPQQIVPAVAAAIDFPLRSSGEDLRRSPEQQLLDFLRDKRMLLLMDNLEHLPEAGALITGILVTAEGVKVLATSRERLQLPGEQLYPLAGLSYPAEDSDPGKYDAPQLFLERARQNQPDFALGEAENEDLVRICQVVDGMPLALELAAAWTDTLVLSAIRRELEAGLGFLATDAPGVVDRHRSMEVAFDASWRRLTEKERRAFARLSVFRGGFTREAAEHAAGASLAVLGGLVGKSFVRFQRNLERYDIHELMRQYGTLRLAENPADEADARDRHAAFFCELLAWGDGELKGRGQLDALAVLDAERGNLQVAWEHALAGRDLVQIQEAMDGLGRYYEWTGNLAGGMAAFTAAAEAAGDYSCREATRVRAHGLAWLANFELLSGDVEQAESDLAASVALLDQLAADGEDVGREKALALLYRGNLEQPRDLRLAIDAYHKSSLLYEEGGLRWESLIGKSWLGKCHQILHDDEAGPLLTEARDGLEQVGDRRSLGRVLEDIAIYYMLNTAQLDKCLETIQESLELRRQTGDLLGIAASLNTLGGAYCWLGEYGAAAVALDEALGLVRRLSHRAGECKVLLDSLKAHHALGHEERAQYMAERCLAMARELGQARYTTYALVLLAVFELIRGAHEKAHELAIEAFEVLSEAGIPVVEPWPHAVRACAAWKVGMCDEATDHIAFALRETVGRNDLFNAVVTLRILAQVTAVRGDLERAAEIGAAAGAVSKWEESLTVRKAWIEPLDELISGLDPEIADAARDRGRARDVFEVAAELLQEVQSPDWRWA